MVRLALCNCSRDEASSLARRLVEDELAACVNVFDGVTSIYRWDDELCEDREATLLIKTTSEQYQAMAESLASHHSYDVPEIIAVDPADVAPPYAEWVHEQVR